MQTAPSSTSPFADALSPASDAGAPRVDEPTSGQSSWPLPHKLAFRFFAVYFVLQVEPWNWFRAIPGVSFLLQPWDRAVDWAVRAATFVHIRDPLVPPNGSGDTSYAYAQFYLYLIVAAAACVIWSLIDHKRPHYARAAFWLRQIVRYYVAIAALSYGIIKVFALQMGFPTLSQLATPLGDLLPMRFSWLFIGYSEPYQMFAGWTEMIGGLLLLYRRTVTAGLLVAAGAFANVLMINLSYDVPVKLYAAHLLFASVFLLAFDAKRLVRFLLLNQPAPSTGLWDLATSRHWQRWGARGVKAFLVWQFLLIPLQSGWERRQFTKQPVSQRPFAQGVYDVRSFVVGRDTIPAAANDGRRWNDVIIDNPAGGSVGTRDSVFWQRYGRGYFRYRPDTAQKTVAVWKISTKPRDSTFLFNMRYEVPDSATIRWHALIRGDSVHVEMVRTARHFQLAERQFHWLSEYNR